MVGTGQATALPLISDFLGSLGRRRLAQGAAASPRGVSCAPLREDIKSKAGAGAWLEPGSPALATVEKPALRRRPPQHGRSWVQQLGSWDGGRGAAGAWHGRSGPPVPQHMREAAERRQQLELEHEQALAVLNAKQQEIELLQKVSWAPGDRGALGYCGVPRLAGSKLSSPPGHSPPSVGSCWPFLSSVLRCSLGSHGAKNGLIRAGWAEVAPQRHREATPPDCTPRETQAQV